MSLAPERKAYSVFLQATDRPYVKELHCLDCGIIVAQITGEVIAVVDNQGRVTKSADLSYEIHTVRPVVRLMCPRSSCKRYYHVHL